MGTIIAVMRDPNASIRAMAADVLGDIEDDQAIGSLERALGSDNDARVRAEAAMSLGESPRLRRLLWGKLCLTRTSPCVARRRRRSLSWTISAPRPLA